MTGLTVRQQQILRLAVGGWSSKQIARDLRISVRTVESHFAEMRNRTGCGTLGGLTAWAVAAGIAHIHVADGTVPGHLPGRPRLMTAEKITEASRLLGVLSVADIAVKLGVSRGTLYSHMAAIRAARE